jgi:hypothetical protein
MACCSALGAAPSWANEAPAASATIATAKQRIVIAMSILHS